eukprot:SAG11_NODE_6361_length_1329_cov_0.747154_3_plen_87_part_00
MVADISDFRGVVCVTVVYFVVYYGMMMLQVRSNRRSLALPKNARRPSIGREFWRLLCRRRVCRAGERQDRGIIGAQGRAHPVEPRR